MIIHQTQIQVYIFNHKLAISKNNNSINFCICFFVKNIPQEMPSYFDTVEMKRKNAKQLFSK